MGDAVSDIPSPEDVIGAVVRAGLRMVREGDGWVLRRSASAKDETRAVAIHDACIQYLRRRGFDDAASALSFLPSDVVDDVLTKQRSGTASEKPDEYLVWEKIGYDRGRLEATAEHARSLLNKGYDADYRAALERIADMAGRESPIWNAAADALGWARKHTPRTSEAQVPRKFVGGALPPPGAIERTLAAHAEQISKGGTSMRAAEENSDPVGRESGMAGSCPDATPPHVTGALSARHGATEVAADGPQVPASADGRMAPAGSSGGAEMQGIDPGASSCLQRSDETWTGTFTCIKCGKTEPMKSSGAGICGDCRCRTEAMDIPAEHAACTEGDASPMGTGSTPGAGAAVNPPFAVLAGQLDLAITRLDWNMVENVKWDLLDRVRESAPTLPDDAPYSAFGRKRYNEGFQDGRNSSIEEAVQQLTKPLANELVALRKVAEAAQTWRQAAHSHDGAAWAWEVEADLARAVDALPADNASEDKPR
jgi:hypothetical protein